MTWEICNQRDHYLHNYRFIAIAFSSFANSDCELIDLVITIIMNALMKQTSENNRLSLHLYSSVRSTSCRRPSAEACQFFVERLVEDVKKIDGETPRPHLSESLDRHDIKDSLIIVISASMRIITKLMIMMMMIAGGPPTSYDIMVRRGGSTSHGDYGWRGWLAGAGWLAGWSPLDFLLTKSD